MQAGSAEGATPQIVPEHPITALFKRVDGDLKACNDAQWGKVTGKVFSCAGASRMKDSFVRGAKETGSTPTLGLAGAAVGCFGGPVGAIAGFAVGTCAPPLLAGAGAALLEIGEIRADCKAGPVLRVITHALDDLSTEVRRGAKDMNDLVQYTNAMSRLRVSSALPRPVILFARWSVHAAKRQLFVERLQVQVPHARTVNNLGEAELPTDWLLPGVEGSASYFADISPVYLSQHALSLAKKEEILALSNLYDAEHHNREFAWSRQDLVFLLDGSTYAHRTEMDVIFEEQGVFIARALLQNLVAPLQPMEQ